MPTDDLGQGGLTEEHIAVHKEGQPLHDICPIRIGGKGGPQRHLNDCDGQIVEKGQRLLGALQAVVARLPISRGAPR